jgi:hypothetical protein
VIASSLFPADVPLEGNVVLSAEGKLYPTASAALAAPKPKAPPRYLRSALVLPVVDAPRGAVKVRTEDDTGDCAWSRTRSYIEPTYVIEAFAPREHLVARVARGMLVEHADGTGAWVAKGAPVRVLADGRGELWDETLAKVVGFVPRDRLALATTSTREDPTWKHVLAPLACDPKPQSVDDWRAGESKRRLAEADAQRDAERQRQYEACLARERSAPPTPPPANGRPTPFGTVKLSCADIFKGGGIGQGLGGLGGFGLGQRGVEAPYCTASAPERNADISTQVDGKPFVKLASIAASSTGGAKVGQGAGGAYVAEVHRTCGALRVEVPEEAVVRGGSGAGLGGLAGGGAVLYARVGSDVTWPDGTRAGKVTRSGPVRADALTPTADDRLCRKVAPFAEPLCQSKDDLCRAPGCRDAR